MYHNQGGVMRFFTKRADPEEIVPMVMFYTSYYSYRASDVDGRPCI
jgi:hypothetical protein